VKRRLGSLLLATLAAACANSGSAKSDLVVAKNEGSAGPAPTRSGAKARHFTFRYEATVKSAPEGSKTVDLWLPVAHDTEFQKVKVTAVNAPAGHEINVEPTLANKIFHVRAPASALPLAVSIDYDVERTERRTDLAAPKGDAAIPAGERPAYLQGTQLVPVGAAVETMAGFKSSGGDSVAVARQAYDHVFKKMRYDKPDNSGWGKGSTEWACKEGFGNCTDFHAYFMSIARTENLPCRFTMGVSLPTDKHEGELAGYHCWAEFFSDGRGWIPVDISEASKAAAKSPEMVDYYFGGLTADRVEFSLGRDVPLVPKQAGAPLNFFVYPYCEIDGKVAAKDAIARKFSFKDL
jgi:transglutaminase-like putative cysteine protease